MGNKLTHHEINNPDSKTLDKLLIEADKVANTQGPMSLEAGICYANIGFVQKKQGNFNSALEFYLRAYAILEGKAGPNDTNLASIIKNMGIVYEELGNHEEAMKYLSRYCEYIYMQEDPTDMELSQTYILMSKVYTNQEQYEEASDFILKALNIRQKQFGEYSMELVSCYRYLCSVNLKLKNLELAKHAAAEALRILKSNGKQKGNEIAQVHDLLGVIYAEEKEVKLAEEHFNLSIKLMDFNAFYDKGQAMCKLAEGYDKNNKISKAIEAYKGAIDFFRADKKSYEIDIAIIYQKIAALLLKKQSPNKALSNYKNSLNILLKAYGQTHPAVIKLYFKIGLLCKKLNLIDEAMASIEKAYLLKSQEVGEDHEETKLIRAEMIDVKTAWELQMNKSYTSLSDSYG